jgi:hypothetical protein
VPCSVREDAVHADHRFFLERARLYADRLGLSTSDWRAILSSATVALSTEVRFAILHATGFKFADDSAFLQIEDALAVHRRAFWGRFGTSQTSASNTKQGDRFRHLWLGFLGFTSQG